MIPDKERVRHETELELWKHIGIAAIMVICGVFLLAVSGWLCGVRP